MGVGVIVLVGVAVGGVPVIVGVFVLVGVGVRSVPVGVFVEVGVVVELGVIVLVRDGVCVGRLRMIGR